MASCKKLHLSQVHLRYVVISSLLENGGKEVLQETFKFTRVPGLLEFQVNLNFLALQENQVNLKFTWKLRFKFTWVKLRMEVSWGLLEIILSLL